MKVFVKILCTFELRFLRKEEQQNFTRNLAALFMATSMGGFRGKFHSSTSARPCRDENSSTGDSGTAMQIGSAKIDPVRLKKGFRSGTFESP